MVISRDRNVGENNNIKVGNKFFEKVEHFKYLGKSLAIPFMKKLRAD
jgi:hypothetical protein